MSLLSFSIIVLYYEYDEDIIFVDKIDFLLKYFICIYVWQFFDIQLVFHMFVQEMAIIEISRIVLINK